MPTMSEERLREIRVIAGCEVLDAPSAILVDAICDLLAALDAATQWQAIETAPKDKTMVALIHLRSDGSWRTGVGWYMPLDGWQVWNFGGTGVYEPPTHWARLPPAPPTPRET